jgi:hypothetical protein
MYLIPFVQLFPDQGTAETRTITTRNHEVLPGTTPTPWLLTLPKLTTIISSEI